MFFSSVSLSIIKAQTNLSHEKLTSLSMGAAELNAGEASARKSRNLEVLGILFGIYWGFTNSQGVEVDCFEIQLTNSGSWTIEKPDDFFFPQMFSNCWGCHQNSSLTLREQFLPCVYVSFNAAVCADRWLTAPRLGRENEPIHHCLLSPNKATIWKLRSLN